MDMAIPPPNPANSVVGAHQAVRDVWELVIWNDDVNLLTYVIYVLRQRFNMSQAQASELAWTIHEHGSAVAHRGGRAEVEGHCQALHISGIQATVRAA